MDKILQDSKSLNERNDCAVQAVAIVTNTPYKVVHKMMAARGRRARGCTLFTITKDVLKALGVYVERVDGQFRGKTVRAIEQELPKQGRFLIRTRGHILACVNGEVKDWTKGRKHRPVQILQVSF